MMERLFDGWLEVIGVWEGFSRDGSDGVWCSAGLELGLYCSLLVTPHEMRVNLPPFYLL